MAQIAKEKGIQLKSAIDIIDPEQVYEEYVIPLTDLRKHKGMTQEIARHTLQDPIYIGTMMLQMGIFDGLVAGASTPTANIISPAFKIIKTEPKLKACLFFIFYVFT